jgi:hypothetical protein
MAITFKYNKSTCPENEDDMHVAFKDGVETNFAVQDCRSYGGHYAVNEYTTAAGHIVSCYYHGEHRSLVSAKNFIIEKLK